MDRPNLSHEDVNMSYLDWPVRREDDKSKLRAGCGEGREKLGL